MDFWLKIRICGLLIEGRTEGRARRGNSVAGGVEKENFSEFYATEFDLALH